MQTLISFYHLYKPQGLVQALIATLRLLILPFWKIDGLLPKTGNIVDIGCGAGVMANYLAVSSPKRSILGVDLSKSRIISAKRTVGKRQNIKFQLKDINRMAFQQSCHYFMVDVLHHISYQEQEKILKLLAKKLNNGNLLIIKEVDNSNTLPFLFGHLWEKVLYPQQEISVRSKFEWMKLLDKLSLKYKILGGSPLFPDSTLIFVCKKHING